MAEVTSYINKSGSGNLAVTVECIIGNTYVITNSAAVVTGLSNNSTTITCSAFAGKVIDFFIGSTLLPGINPGGGGAWASKTQASNVISLNFPLQTGDIIKINAF